METTGAGDQNRLPGCDVLGVAASLRWSRPDLTGALAQFRMESASALGDRDGWLTAAGWQLYAAAATGDGRDTAAEVLEALPRWGSDVLRRPAADRFRMELAVLGYESGEVRAAQALLPRLASSSDVELAADLHVAAARCQPEDRIDDGAPDRSAAPDEAWSETLAACAAIGGARGEIGTAAAQLVGAAAARRSGRSGIAIDRAVDGLARLDRGRDTPQGLSPSGHLAAALAAEWIAALIDAGRPEEARDGSGPLRDRLVEHVRPTRQLAVLRLTLARAAASDPLQGSDLVLDLERAAQDAAASDIPALEHICRLTLAEMYESAGRLDAAQESVRTAADADRRDRARAERFRAALAGTESIWAAGVPRLGPIARPRDWAGSAIRRAFDVAPTRPSTGPEGVGPSPASGPPDRTIGNRAAAGVERTTILRAVQAAAMSDRPDDGPFTRHRPEEVSGRFAADGSPPAEAGSLAGYRSSSVPDADPETGAGTIGEATSVAPDASTGPTDGNPAARRAWVQGAFANDSVAGDTEPSNGTAPRGEVLGHGSAQAEAAPADPGTGNRPATPAADPWATGDWTPPSVASPGRPRPADDSASEGLDPTPAGADDHAPPAVPAATNRTQADVERERVESALADPDTWLATAMAELDRIWGIGDSPVGAVDEEPAAAEADSCVVVLDLVLAGERLPADAAAPTVRRLTRRIEDRLPPESRLRDDGPDSVSVVLPGGDRTVASEWLQRILPALVDGLAVDAAAGGAMLRAAVHDAAGEAGAQILQRLDGTRGRSGVPTEGARDAAGKAARTGDAGPMPAGTPAANGSGTNGVGRRTSPGPILSVATPRVTSAPAARGPAAEVATPAAEVATPPAEVATPPAEIADSTPPDGAHAEPPVAARDLAAPGPGPLDTSPERPSPEHPSSERPSPERPSPERPSPERPSPERPSPEPPSPEPPSPEPDTGGVTRHDQSAERRPYLPAGVVVRPGSGGRRHRRTAEQPAETPEPAEASDPAPQSPDGLGLADLLAGALAAYRRI